MICLVGTMESSEVSVEDRVEDHEAERTEKVEERRFKVGELVEFWDSALVRGNRTDMVEESMG
jgi:hypothetical protein